MPTRERTELDLGGPLEMSLNQVVSEKNTGQLPCCLARYYWSWGCLHWTPKVMVKVQPGLLLLRPAFRTQLFVTNITGGFKE